MQKAAALKARLDKLTDNSEEGSDFMVNGQVLTIPQDHILDAFIDAMDGRDNPYARIMRNATASQGCGKLLALLHAVIDPLPRKE